MSIVTTATLGGWADVALRKWSLRWAIRLSVAAAIILGLTLL
jgi:hypothetical protein